MTNPIIKIIDGFDEIEREMTDSELAVHKAIIKDIEKQEKLKSNKQEEKQAVLDKLGLTADEISALLS